MLKTYVSSFDQSFIALRGTPDQTRATAGEFKVFYAKVPSKDGRGYSIDHVFDPQGRVRLFARYGGDADALRADIKRLLAESGPPGDG